MPTEQQSIVISNEIRTAILRLQQLDEAECAALLASLQNIGLADDESILEITNLTATANPAWKTLYIGELKTLLALAIGDKHATLEGCNWIHHFGQMEDPRRRVYRCVDGLINMHKTEMFHHSLELMYGTETLYLAMDLLKRKQRFFGLDELGLDM
jgi:ribosomal protein S12 methylthiotransferase accessory factor